MKIEFIYTLATKIKYLGWQFQPAPLATPSASTRLFLQNDHVDPLPSDFQETPYFFAACRTTRSKCHGKNDIVSGRKKICINSIPKKQSFLEVIN